MEDFAVDFDALREKAGEVSGMLKILSHPNRLLVACELMDGERSVSEIEARTGVRQPNLSRDLARLRAAGLVATRRQAKLVFYRLKDPQVRTLMAALCDVFAPEGKPAPSKDIQP
ncbi:MAG: metalloregulator ArsR/SmtB family transcription factor [Pseudomonadota bacterium]